MKRSGKSNLHALGRIVRMGLLAGGTFALSQCSSTDRRVCPAGQPHCENDDPGPYYQFCRSGILDCSNDGDGDGDLGDGDTPVSGGGPTEVVWPPSDLGGQGGAQASDFSDMCGVVYARQVLETCGLEAMCGGNHLGTVCTADGKDTVCACKDYEPGRYSWDGLDHSDRESSPSGEDFDELNVADVTMLRKTILAQRRVRFEKEIDSPRSCEEAIVGCLGSACSVQGSARDDACSAQRFCRIEPEQGTSSTTIQELTCVRATSIWTCQCSRGESWMADSQEVDDQYCARKVGLCAASEF